ncbi:microtubule-associated protein 9 [Stegastes partitus]|uniref:Microtubule-associated protein 9 n=1 Tax=Stegastes partitus TaxID=144197 RepID=A0A9Y4JPT9_9TELE|nr:PREDICTED: microtubule-associated protein 9 [Stegastes partitus]
MMTTRDFTTLAYTISPKTSKRTTFQDELQAAVSVRASKTKTVQYSNYDDFDEDEDDFLNELLKSRKKRNDALKAGKSKAKTNTFELSDDEDKHSRTKKVSFLKSQRISSPSNDTTASESHENEPPDSSTAEHINHNGSFSSQHSKNISEDSTQFKNSAAGSIDHQITRENSSKSLSYQTSDDTLLDMSLPLPSDGSMIETPAPVEKMNSLGEESSQTPQLSASGLDHAASAEREPPRPKPRQRTLGLSVHATQKLTEETTSQDLSRPQTSSASIPLSSDTSSNIAIRSCSPQWTEGDYTASCSPSKSPSNKSEHSQLFTKSTVDSGSRDGFISDESKDQARKYSTSFEEFNECSGNHSDQLSHAPEKSFDTRTSSSQRPQSVCSKKVESKYLGSLKVLDRKVSLQESELQAADSLRAAIYQEWLKKKKEKSKESMQLKKKDEILKEKKKKEQEAKKEDAVASYEAWKEKKSETLKAKAKERQDVIRKEQRAAEEKEEKRQSAAQVFEKWKRERDRLLKEKHRKQKEAENKLKVKKQETEEERKRDSKSAFSDWCEKKKDVLHEKLTTERKEFENKAEEERYMTEERDKMALEMYENWLILTQYQQEVHNLVQAIAESSLELNITKTKELCCGYVGKNLVDLLVPLNIQGQLMEQASGIVPKEEPDLCKSTVLF